MSGFRTIGASSILCLLCFGCTRVPQANDNGVDCLINSKIDKHVEWYQGCPDDQINSAIQCLLENELTPEAAIQIALLKNPKVQSIFEELGIAHADLVEAGLLSNPDFSVEVRYPYKKNLVTNIEYLVTATFLDIFLIPLRTRLAAAEFEQAKRRVTNEILDLAFEVRQTYYELLGEQQKLKYIRPIVELTSIHGEIASRQKIIGNVNRLDFQQVQARFLEAKLEIAKEQTTIIRLSEKLNRLLGLSEEICLILPEIPQDIDYEGYDICALESIALAERMDLQEARFEVIRLRRMLGLKDWWTYTNLKAGVAGERDPDRLNLVGFGLSGEIPIFNFGQAARMRIFAQLRQAQDRYETLEIRILSEVREAHKLLMSDLGMINDYRIRIIPLQNEIINSSEELYNVMGLGIDRLIENKRQELEANRNYFEILKDYWVARVQLDKALGGYLFRLLSKDGCIEGAIE
ncbi:MAG: TolC family protein [Bacteriovoracaceae bacterium]|jgi:cobalt-zinc-cadmium efflux system outer membrane protein|nr:TolC family protein [Bacteriovoracaceae bacterium]